VHLAPVWGYGRKGNEKFNIPPNAGLDFEIELKNFEKAKDSWQMNSVEKLDESEKLKTRGTEFFQQGKNKLAVIKYQKIVDYLQHESSLEGEQKEKRDNLYRAAQLNLALVFLKQNETHEAIKHCEKVLEEDKTNVKALYRRAQAYQNQNDFDLAIKDYETVLTVEPDNKAAQGQIVICKKKMAELAQKEKKLYVNMFKNLSKDEDKEKVGKSSAEKMDAQPACSLQAAGEMNGDHVTPKLDDVEDGMFDDAPATTATQS